MPDFITQLDKRILLETPSGDPVPDGEGGFTQGYQPLVPGRVWGGWQPASAQNMERLTAGTVVSTAEHLWTIRYHPDVDTRTRVTFHFKGVERQFTVNGVSTHPKDDQMLVLSCLEVVR